ncbi:MAG: nucleotidyl transferase AbiEii/AbiGii toxin family protein, partial [Eubacteriaceae bacterium]|nr:nucleotidyl transferase AbiEii/AbiGii toxin family protein [Eubacteriaceae bacterium]
MYEIAKLPGEEREILFQNTAAKMGMNAAIIEKDFWVCLTLDYLFHKCQWKKAFAFKGGTSLSKVYGLIDRFSEDIDLILDWRTIGYGYNEPWKKRSNTQQQKFI